MGRMLMNVLLAGGGNGSGGSGGGSGGKTYEKFARLFNAKTPDHSVNLTDDDFPDGYELPPNAFHENGKIGSFSNSKITNIPAYAFALLEQDGYTQCQLTSLSAPQVESIGAYGCSYQYNMPTPDFLGKLKTIGEGAFTHCDSFTGDINLDNLTDLGLSAFYACGGIETVSAPKVTEVIGNAFAMCSSLRDVDLAACTTIGGAFSRCESLKTLHLGSQTVCTLTTEYAFEGEFGFFGGGDEYGVDYGTITVYVPDELVSEYQTATNWSVLVAVGRVQFKPESEM